MVAELYYAMHESQFAFYFSEADFVTWIMITINVGTSIEIP